MSREAARTVERPLPFDAPFDRVLFDRAVDDRVGRDTDWLLSAYYDSWDRERAPDGRSIIYDSFTVLSQAQRHEAHRAVEGGPHRPS